MRPQGPSVSPDDRSTLILERDPALKPQYNVVRLLGLAYLVSVPLETLPFPIVRSPSMLLGAVWLVSWLADLAITRRTMRIDTKFFVLLLAASAWAFATTAWSYNYAESQQFAISLAALGISAIAISDVFREDITAPAIALASGAAIAGLAVLSAGPDATRQDRASFEGIDENIMSFHLCLGVAMCVYLLFKLRTPLSRAIVLGGGVLIGLAALLTGSRTGAVALLATLVLGALVLARSPIRVVVSLGLVVVLYFLGQQLLTSGFLPMRIAEFVSGDVVVDTRPLILENFVATQENWWQIGIGAGSDADYLAATAGWYSNVHNAFWQVFIEQGIIGLAIWFTLFLVCLARALHAPMRLAILLCVPTIAAFMWTLGPLESNMLWALAGLGLVGRTGLAGKETEAGPPVVSQRLHGSHSYGAYE